MLSRDAVQLASLSWDLRASPGSRALQQPPRKANPEASYYLPSRVYMNRRDYRLPPLLVWLALGMTLRLPAQVEQASLTGIISDKSGAAVAESQISAENLATNVKTSTYTNASGNFYMKLWPGDYKISVGHQGFATAVVPKLTLSVAQQATLNLVLEVSSVQQQVTVSDIAPLLDQETAGLGASIQPEQFVE